MRHWIARALTAALIMIGTGTGARAEGDPAFGFWLTENARAIVEIAPCTGKVCGRVIWSAAPRAPDGTPKRDENNDDPALRSRSLCGLDLLGGLAREDSGKWRDGWIYNPRNGGTYSLELDSVDQQRLKVRGYLGLSLLGKSQIWTRVEDARGGC